MVKEHSKHEDTLDYYKTGKITTIYQTYLDICEDIENSDLGDLEKEAEKEKVLQARKEAFGEENFRYYPPWKKR